MTEDRMRPYMKVFSLVVYVVLQVLCLPLLIVGVLLATYRQMVVSKRLRTRFG